MFGILKPVATALGVSGKTKQEVLHETHEATHLGFIDTTTKLSQLNERLLDLAREINDVVGSGCPCANCVVTRAKEREEREVERKKMEEAKKKEDDERKERIEEERRAEMARRVREYNCEPDCIIELLRGHLDDMCSLHANEHGDDPEYAEMLLSELYPSHYRPDGDYAETESDDRDSMNGLWCPRCGG